MKCIFKVFAILVLVISFAGKSNAGTGNIFPTYDMTINNIQTQPNATTGADSVIQFDVMILWTNSGVSDPFEFGASQLAIRFNRNIVNPGASMFANKVLISGGINFPSVVQNSTVQIISNPDGSDTWLFQASANLPNSTTNFFVSDVTPGNRMGRFKVRTSQHTWNPVMPNIKFQLTLPNNTYCVYFMPSTDPKDPDLQFIGSILDTFENHYISDSTFILPVELRSFTSNVKRNNVLLSWSTAGETNNQGFEVERATAGSSDWTKAGFVSGNGTTNEEKNYSFSDRVNTGHYNYRLKQIDYNGNTQFFALNEEVVVGTPTEYALSQNYPNPFNPSTKIDYDIPYDGKVSILLYDISGREVGKLVNEMKTAGYYTVQFNASNLASGMYFYRITAQGNNQNFVLTKKMMLVK